MIFTVAESIGFLALWIFFFCLYRDFRVDEYRQKLFRLRDELYDYAAAGNMQFSDEAYGLLRSTINGSIRYAHRLGPVYLGLMAYMRMGSIEKSLYSQRWERAKAKLSDEQQMDICRFKNRLHGYLIWQLFLTSPLFLLPLLFAAVVFLIGLVLSIYVSDRLKKWFAMKLDGLVRRIDGMAWQEAQVRA